MDTKESKNSLEFLALFATFENLKDDDEGDGNSQVKEEFYASFVIE